MTSFALGITLTILLFISPILLTTANAYNIRDLKGKKVINGGNYYIRPYMGGPDEWSITWAYNASIINQNCPLLVTQGYDTLTPVTLSTYLSSKYLSLSAEVFITFQDNTSPCNNELRWSGIGSYSNVNIGYVGAGNPLSPIYASFHIVDAGINQKNVYKFTYCDDEDEDVGGGCADVGWLTNSSDPYLVITSDLTIINPFYFVLVQAF